MQTARETATAEARKGALSNPRRPSSSEVDATRVRSEASTLISMAEAQARVTLERANSERDELLARAQGAAALIESGKHAEPRAHRLQA